MILIVDDDPSVLASLSLLLKQAGFASHAVSDPADAQAWLASHLCQLVLQDMNFTRQTTGEEGLSLLTAIRAAHPQLPVVLITAWGSIDLAVRGMKAGASDFITKPWTNEQILQTVRTALALSAVPAAPDLPPSREDLDAAFDFGDLVGEDPRLLKVLQAAGRVSATDASVLITGESGTGKELVADAIHRNSRRRHGPFVKVNLGGISSSLFESEMFGHVRGAFTDAASGPEGTFRARERWHHLPRRDWRSRSASQVKLLRVLQDRSFEVLGSSQRRTVDVRVISATNRSLPRWFSAGSFARICCTAINLITLHLPSLRERRDDIRILASRFVSGRRRGVQIAHRPRLTEDALRYLVGQPWPGNIRQLRQAIDAPCS